MEVSKAEIEDQVKKILKLVTSKENGITKDAQRDSELVGLINNFHDQYQSLYALYNNLKGESVKSPKRFRGRKDKGLIYSPCYSSDSEYYSSEEVEIDASTLRHDDPKAARSFEQEVTGSSLEVTNLRNKLMSTTEEKEALDSEHQEALSKIQAAEVMNKNLRDAADERLREISALAKVHEAHGSRTSAKIEELEGQLSSLKLELGSMLDQNRDLEAQCATKATEANVLEKKNVELQAQVDNSVKQVKENEKNSTSKIEKLKSQVSYLQQEVNAIRAPKEQAVEQVRGLIVQASVMQQDLVSLTSQKNELELELKGKTKEVSEYLTQMKTVKGELTLKTETEHKILQEKEDFAARMKDLEIEVGSLCNQKKKLEELIDHKINDARQLREENDRLLAKLSETGKELSALQTKFEGRDDEASNQNLSLKAKVAKLQQKLDDLQVKRIQLNSQIVREERERSESMAQMEQQNIKLTNKIAEQQNIMKNQDGAIEKLTEECNQAKRQILGSKTSLQIAERKMTELAEEFRKRLEDNIRVLFRRIQVAEQLHNETKDSHKRTLEQLEESNRLLTCNGQSRKMTDIFEAVNKALLGVESVVDKLDTNGELSNRLTKMSDELALAKNWVTESKNSNRSLQQQAQSLIAKLEEKKEQESLLRGEISNLEGKIGSIGGDKMNIVKTLSELENRIKEKDSELLSLRELEKRVKEQDAEFLILGEEKREAIRQLCLFIDYHRTDCDYLKGEIAKTVRAGKTTT